MNFMGYLRPDGQVGVRNYVAVLPAVNCMNDAAYKLAGETGAVALCHSFTCVNAGDDREKARRGMLGLAKNPNIAAVLILGVGCEPYRAAYLASEVKKTGKPVLSLSISDYADYDEFMRRGQEFLKKSIEAASSEQRVPCDISKLVVGSKCGGSGSISIISNNAALGRAFDMLIDRGASCIFSETAELLGAEKVLARRGVTPEVSQKLLDCVERLKADIVRTGVNLLGAEPTGGNIQSGLTTIEEKSLGAIAKSGTSPLVDVLEFAQERTKGSGLYYMDCESSADPVYVGAMGAGSQLGIFSIASGHATRFHAMPSCSSGIFVYPAIKVLGSSDDADQKDYFDCYVGGILTGGESLSEAGERLFNIILQTASGEKTYTEKNNKYYATISFNRTSLIM